MSTAFKKIQEKGHSFATVSDKVKSYADDPYFVKKANEAKKTIKKFGLPDISKK